MLFTKSKREVHGCQPVLERQTPATANIENRDCISLPPPFFTTQFCPTGCQEEMNSDGAEHEEIKLSESYKSTFHV